MFLLAIAVTWLAYVLYWCKADLIALGRDLRPAIALNPSLIFLLAMLSLCIHKIIFTLVLWPVLFSKKYGPPTHATHKTVTFKASSYLLLNFFHQPKIIITNEQNFDFKKRIRLNIVFICKICSGVILFIVKWHNVLTTNHLWN